MDTIYREQAIDAMGCLNDSICEQQAVDALWELPSAEKTGRWFRGNMPTYGGYKCSVCGDNSISKFHYCPNCEAKMEG